MGFARDGFSVLVIHFSKPLLFSKAFSRSYRVPASAVGFRFVRGCKHPFYGLLRAECDACGGMFLFGLGQDPISLLFLQTECLLSFVTKSAIKFSRY